MSTPDHQPQRKRPGVLFALLPIIFLVATLGLFVIVLEQDVHIPLILGSGFATLLAIYGLGYHWADIEGGIMRTINMGMQAILILMIVGVLIGTWIISGIVPTMIYYGLKLIAPSVFLAVSMIICSIVSLATGSSWTTAGTVGVALIGVAHGLGVPLPMAAGAIISGAYFGDKMSPLSDTTNLAPAMAGSTLFDHIKHMIYTTGPSYIISFALFLVIGFKYSGQIEGGQVKEIMDLMNASFNINLLLLIPPILVILMVVFRVPAIPGLLAGALLGVVFAMLFQGAEFGTIMDVAQNGFTFELAEGASVTEVMVGELLTRGGLQSMMWTVSLIICALTFGGIMEATGMLEVLATGMLRFAVNNGSLVLVTILSSIFINVIAADQYLSIVIPGRMYKDAYAEKHLAPRNLSRTLEDGGTLSSPLIPWNTCGAYMQGALGVGAVEYWKFCFLNLLNPIIAVLFAYLNIFQLKMTPEEIKAYEESKKAILI